MDLDTLVDRAYDLLSQAPRGPGRDEVWGLWYYDDSPVGMGGGVGTFAWFKTCEEMLQFVLDVFPFYNSGSSTTDPIAAANTIKGLVEQIPTSDNDLERLRTGLNGALDGLCQIEWMGTFSDLMHGTSSFANDIRGKFRENESDSVILPSERDDFVSFPEESVF